MAGGGQLAASADGVGEGEGVVGGVGEDDARGGHDEQAGPVGLHVPQRRPGEPELRGRGVVAGDLRGVALAEQRVPEALGVGQGDGLVEEGQCSSGFESVRRARRHRRQPQTGAQDNAPVAAGAGQQLARREVVAGATTHRVKRPLLESVPRRRGHQ